MCAMSELHLHITPSSNTIMAESVKNGVRSCKQVSYKTLIESIQKSLELEHVTSGLLPVGCLSFAMEASGFYTVSILHPECQADITYEKTEYKDFPLPRLVFKFRLKKGLRVQQCWMGVVGKGMLTPETPMYWYPFSNVGTGYGLCTGSNLLPKCKSLHTLSSLPYYILGMPNNNDHFSNKRNKPELEMRDLMDLLKDKDPDYYYSDILIPDKHTIMDFINAK